MNSMASIPGNRPHWTAPGTGELPNLAPPTVEAVVPPVAPVSRVAAGVGHVSMDAAFGPPTGLNTRDRVAKENADHAAQMGILKGIRESWVNPKYEPEDVRLVAPSDTDRGLRGSLSEASEIEDKKSLWKILTDRDKIIEEPALDEQGRLQVDEQGNIVTQRRTVLRTTQGYGAFKNDRGGRVTPRGARQNRQANKIWAHRRHEGHVLSEISELESSSGLYEIDHSNSKSKLRGQRFVLDDNGRQVPDPKTGGRTAKVEADPDGKIQGSWRLRKRVRSAERKHAKLKKSLHHH